MKLKKLTILRKIMKKTAADKLLTGFLGYTAITALIIYIIEPGITTWRQALWYCYAVISTTGFGDIVVQTMLGKALSVLLTIYSLLIIAIITGVVVSYYNETVLNNSKMELDELRDKLKNLPELPKKELEEIARKFDI